METLGSCQAEWNYARLEKEGFETIHEQQVFIDGILLKNFKMAKSLH